MTENPNQEHQDPAEPKEVDTAVETEAQPTQPVAAPSPEEPSQVGEVPDAVEEEDRSSKQD